MSMTRQIPMLFSPAMVNALLAGRKTETRRMIHSVSDDLRIYIKKSKTSGLDGLQNIHDAARRGDLRCAPGNLIWVRENWRVGAWRAEHWARGNEECDAQIAVDYMADQYARKEWLKGSNPDMMLRLIDQSRHDAKKDGNFKQDAEFQYRWPPGGSPCRVRPSIHMPKFASRLTLRVTSYNVERLHDISSRGCLAEGTLPDHEILRSISAGHSEKHRRNEYHRAHVSAYQTLWNTINGSNAWAANPWVDVTKFEVIHQNVKYVAAK